jgi:hypothetical protein
MEEKRKNYSVFTTYDGRRRSIVYEEVHEGDVRIFKQPTDSRGRSLLGIVKRLCQNDTSIRLSLEVKNYI